MSSYSSIPDHILPYCRKSNILEWRPVPPKLQVLCTHRSLLLPNFFPRATDGVHTVVELLHNSTLHRIHSTNIIYPESPKTPKGHKKKGKVTKKKDVTTRAGLAREMFPGLTAEQFQRLEELMAMG